MAQRSVQIPGRFSEPRRFPARLAVRYSPRMRKEPYAHVLAKLDAVHKALAPAIPREGRSSPRDVADELSQRPTRTRSSLLTLARNSGGRPTATVDRLLR